MAHIAKLIVSKIFFGYEENIAVVRCQMCVTLFPMQLCTDFVQLLQYDCVVESSFSETSQYDHVQKEEVNRSVAAKFNTMKRNSDLFFNKKASQTENFYEKQGQEVKKIMEKTNQELDSIMEETRKKLKSKFLSSTTKT